MSKLIIDIETFGNDFDKMDDITKQVLMHNMEESDEKYIEELQRVKDELALSPLTGEIVAIGVLDYEKDQGVVYYQSPEIKTVETKEGNFKFKPMKESEMLESFWQGVQNYDEIVTFNGRSFDIPFIIARSAKWQVEITKDLMSNRYIESQRFGMKHIDLFDQLTYYGAARKIGGLHMWCRLLGITSPKSEGIKGEDVKNLFENQEYLKIAKYNTRDLIATKELYDYWERFMKTK